MHRVTYNIHTDSYLFKEELKYLKLNSQFVKDVEAIRKQQGLKRGINAVDVASFRHQIDALIEKYRLQNIHRESLESWVRKGSVTHFMSMNPHVVEYETTIEKAVSRSKKHILATEAWVRLTPNTTKEDLSFVLPNIRRTLRWKGPKRNERAKINTERDLEIFRLREDGQPFKYIVESLNATKKYGKIDVWIARTSNDRVKKRARLK